jgi:guanylate kinase
MAPDRVFELNKGKIAIVGPAATGKDHLRKRFQDRGFTFGISCTTRPPRDGEKDGRDYYFISDEQFQQFIDDDQFVEWQEFNGWKYGMTKHDWETCDLMILNAEAVELLPKEYRERLFVFYIDIPESIRRERLAIRNDKDDSIDRRIKADDEQFRNFSDFDCKITNDKF